MLHCQLPSGQIFSRRRLQLPSSRLVLGAFRRLFNTVKTLTLQAIWRRLMGVFKTVKDVLKTPFQLHFQSSSTPENEAKTEDVLHTCWHYYILLILITSWRLYNTVKTLTMQAIWWRMIRVFKTVKDVLKTSRQHLFQASSIRGNKTLTEDVLNTCWRICIYDLNWERTENLITRLKC